MIRAARMKKGMASSGKLKRPAEILSVRIIRGISLIYRKTKELSSIENATEQLRNRSSKKGKKTNILLEYIDTRRKAP